MDRASASLGIDVDPVALEAWVKEVSPAVTPERLDAGIALACGLYHRQPAALACFESRVIAKARAALKKLNADAHAIDEHLQNLRTRFLVEDGGARLKQYRGVGSFEAFAVTAAVRLLSDAHRGPSSRRAEDTELVLVPAAVDLERALARTGQVEHFSAAFRQALAGLTARERTILKLNLVDGVSIDALAPLYRVSRATAARWLAAARATLQRETLNRLTKRTQLAGGELESLMASLSSGFDLSMARFVAEAAGDDGPAGDGA